MNESGCDLLCLCPHSDDAEIALGGTLRLLADRGRRVWVADLTRGELASNADPAERWREAAAASAVLGLAGRVQLALPDGFLEPADRTQIAAVVWLIRQLRPRWLVTAPEARRHPDHLATPALARRAAFLARLRALTPAVPEARWWPGPRSSEAAATWRVETVGETCPEGTEPSLIVDVSATWEAKREALACYASQFQRDPLRQPTDINDPDFLARIDARGRAWGRRAGVAWGEALRLDGVPVVADLPPERWA
ncbi:MAG TPA: bacillithiol biosynthesis deacetylase BshB1 [Candidatus Krumholzibacteria bacterium]|nr:bacillithiol biosynthesis deacetylase BshB1 [Candidatus Krumholzibacteria bacterium]HPD71687.1 bacillithiol biosynthesis deacetylase BshB1 [Candidatus Krumholzibacteria bacterium]HRY41380.1 bacillithiol biosynthesis deacetylase BshB1 [Candidatus Krumholzibacteria bacterium]